MTDEWIPYVPTEKGQLEAARMRVAYLEGIVQHFDGSTMDLHHYVRAIDGMPTATQWEMVRLQVKEMVNADGNRNPQ